MSFRIAWAGVGLPAVLPEKCVDDFRRGVTEWGDGYASGLRAQSIPKQNTAGP
jgi:hypothetical protein